MNLIALLVPPVDVCIAKSNFKSQPGNTLDSPTNSFATVSMHTVS